MDVDRVKTGIIGLDKLMLGGYPKGSVVLVSGGPGTGKSTFALQYIHSGAKNKEPGVYVSFEQEPKDIANTAKQFGMDFEKLEKEGNVIIIRIKNAKDISDVLGTIKKAVESIKAKRLVIDSLSSIEIFASTFQSIMKEMPLWIIEKKFPVMPPMQQIVRRVMYKVIENLKETGVTVLLTSESQNSDFSRYGIAEFVTDGLISLAYLGIGGMDFRHLKIVKMRKTKHEEDNIPFEFGPNGIKIIPPEKFKA